MSAGSAGRCSACSASVKAGKPWRVEPRRVLPFRQVRDLGQRRVHRLAHHVDRQPFGQRIDRLDQRQLFQLRLAHHAIGMHHLQHAVVERGDARDDAPLAHRQELLEVIALGVEEGEDQVAGVVAGVDLVRRARAVRRRRPVAVDRHRDRCDAARHDVADHRTRTPVDRAARQVKQQVEHARGCVLAREQPLIKLAELRPHAGQRGQRGKQGIEP